MRSFKLYLEDKRLKKLFYIVLFCISLSADTVKVAVAANMSYAMPSIIKSFNKIYPDVKVETVLGSSGKLFAQIKNGAPFDIFLSANMRYPNTLYKENLTVTKPKVYAYGALSLLSGQKRDFTKGLDILKEKYIQKIAIANPKTAPYGKAAVEVLKKTGLYDSLKDKFIYTQSVAQATTYSIIAADIGFVAKSSLFSPHMKKYKKGINWIDVPTTLYTPIKQGIVLIKNSKSSKKFYDFMFSQKAKKIVVDFGYSL